ncbi:hypothetical protein HRG_013091 [Hirsutella rhossiliensis]
MPRRMLIRMACQRCRKKRAKCDDGQAPCKRCDEAGEGRVYDHPRRKSKDDLRAEIDSLRRYNEEHARLLRAICSINDVEVSNAFIQDLVEGTKSHQAILQELAHLNGENGRGSSDGGEQESSAGSSSSILDEAVCPHCLSRLPSPTMHRSASGSSDLSTLTEAPKATSTPALAAPVSPSLPFDDASHAQTDRWTCAGCRKYAKVWATSYRGAVSLIRILRLTTGQVFTMSTSCKLQDDSIFLDQSACSAEYLFGGQCGSGTTPDPALKARGSQLRNLQLIPARVFQLTEWVYKLLSSATHTPNGRFDTAEVMAVYTECLDCMYYQFCLLCLFRPLANLVLADSDVRPREICLQAADSILTLSQSYSRLFTLRRVSPFVPYFLSLATISDVSSVDGQLLAEMSSNRRMASSIEKMLRGYLTELW